MFILGLTGSIAQGKSTCAAMFRHLRVPVHDADAAVHAALAPDGAAAHRVARAFPDALVDGAIDRKRLGAEVFDAPARLAELEAIVHPIAAADARRFLRRWALARAPLVVLDIPLLFEAGATGRVDAVLVVSAPAFLQRQRALARPDMTPARFEAIKRRQMPDTAKCAAADFVVSSGLGKAHTFGALKQLVTLLRHVEGTLWGPAYGS